MKKMALILAAGFYCLGATQVWADTYVKLISDKEESDVYVNGEIAGTFYDLPLEFILPPGKYLIEVKKEYPDGGHDYFKRTIKAGTINTKVAINAVLEREYTEDYYYKKATTIKGAQTYLEKFPMGSFKDRIKGFLEMEYAKKATTVEGAKTYFEKYPDGRYKKAILNKDIYLITQKKEIRNKETKTYNYQYDDRGNLVEETSKDSDGYWKRSTYTYGDRMQRAGKLYERKGKDPQRFTYAYDDNGRLSQESVFIRKKLSKKVLYTYDEKGNLVEELKKNYVSGRYVDSYSYKLTYEYDERNNLIEKLETHLRDGTWAKNTYTYDENGNMVKRRKQEDGYRQFDKTYHYGVAKIVYTRNEQGKILEEIKNPDSKYPVVTRYQYGNKGNLVEKNKHFADGRQIRYSFDDNENLIEEYYFPDSEGYTYTTTWKYRGIPLKNIFQ